MTTEHSPGRSSSVRTLAELARTGYSLMRQPLTEVEFEVHHVADKPGRLLEMLRDEEQPSCVLETMSSGANGVGVVVGTRLDDAPGRQRFRDRGSGADPRIGFVSGEDGHHFRGVARPNLTFLYEAGSRLEGIIAIEDESRTATHSHSLMVKDLLNEITLVAATHAKAPLLSIQCPAQRPVESKAERGRQKPPHSSSLSIRFTIALDEPSVSVRMKLASRLARYCEAHGYRMWLTDTRPGHRVGNWFGIRAHAGTDEKRGLGNPDEGVDRVLPVTFVGPARIGTTHAIVSFLQKFDQVGILGCSTTALDDLAFVHLRLALSKCAPERFPSELAVSDGSDPLTHLAKLLNHFFGDQVCVLGSSGLVDRVRDYQTLAGPLLTHAPVHKERRMAVWVSWQMTRQVQGLVTPIEALMGAWERLCERNLGAEGEPPALSVEYLICRDVGNSVLYGKGKLSVPYALVRAMFPQHSTESPQAQLCVGLEDAWKSELDTAEDGGNVLGVTVAWREYWLGHWSALAD